jgi:predicted RNA-binding Zn-ribbon protein involved in translation (DUF1610 family)
MKVMAKNQCDGCNNNLELRDRIHYKNGHPVIGCTKELYNTDFNCPQCGNITYDSNKCDECQVKNVKSEETVLVSSDDMVSILEVARLALLATPATIADKMDISDERLATIKNKINKILDTIPYNFSLTF